MSKVRNYVCVNLRCKNTFDAKVSDRKRGWAMHCSKSCAATTREKQLDRNNYKGVKDGDIAIPMAMSIQEHDWSKP